MSEFEKVAGKLIDIIVQAVDSEKDAAKLEKYKEMFECIELLIKIEKDA